MVGHPSIHRPVKHSQGVRWLGGVNREITASNDRAGAFRWCHGLLPGTASLLGCPLELHTASSLNSESTHSPHQQVTFVPCCWRSATDRSPLQGGALTACAAALQEVSKLAPAEVCPPCTRNMHMPEGTLPPSSRHPGCRKTSSRLALWSHRQCNRWNFRAFWLFTEKFFRAWSTRGLWHCTVRGCSQQRHCCFLHHLARAKAVSPAAASRHGAQDYAVSFYSGKRCK